MSTERMPSYGGQALIEGVLMRGGKAVAAAMRDPSGNIVLHTEELSGIYQSPIKKIPFLRGLIVLWDALVLGSRFLTMSANVQTKEDEKLEGPALYITLGVAMLIGLGIFVALPSALGQGIESLFKLDIWLVNLLEGAIRLLVAVGYIWAIGKMPDIQRVFAYHGAEHKTINAFEAHSELTPEKVSKFPLEHPRCGTGFLLTVVIISILVFSPLRPLPFLIRLPSQLVLVPLIACLAYEYVRWTANHLDQPLVRVLVAPNLALQKLTTREPSLDMLEVSIASFNAMYALENTKKEDKETPVIEPQTTE
jgi:uncharacterized protein YqhQ